MVYTGKKHLNYIWIPKAKADLKEYRDALKLCSLLQQEEGSFNDKSLGNLQVQSGAIFDGSLTAKEYFAKYKNKELGNRSYISNARMLIRMCRFFGWIYRDGNKKGTYYLTERGNQIAKFVGKFPSQIGNLKEFDLFLEDIVTFRFYCVDDQPMYRNERFKTLPNLQILRFLSRFGYMHHYELAITALSATNLDVDEFNAKSGIIESMRYGDINIRTALRELEHDSSDKSTLTGIYDGPKVLCSFLKQLGLVEPINPKHIPEAYDYYQYAYTDYLIKPPRTIFQITDLGKQVFERYSDIVPMWFDDISHSRNKYTIASTLDRSSEGQLRIENTPLLRETLIELQNQESIPTQLSFLGNSVTKQFPHEGTPNFCAYRDIPPEDRENFGIHEEQLDRVPQTTEMPTIPVQLPIERSSPPKTNHCLNCYPAPCVTYLEHVNTPNSSDYLAYRVCPTNALIREDNAIPPVFDQKNCINCLLCVHRCPIESIETSKADGHIERLLTAQEIPDDREIVPIEYSLITNELTQYLKQLSPKRLVFSSQQRLRIVSRFEEIISPGKDPRIDQNPFYTWVRNVLRGFGYSVSYTGGAGMKTRSDVTIMAPYPVAIEVKSPEERMGVKAVRQTVDAASQLFSQFKRRVYTCVIGQHATPEILKKADEHRDYMLSQGVGQFNIPIIESKLLIHLFLLKNTIDLNPITMEPMFGEFHGLINRNHILQLLDRIGVSPTLRNQIRGELKSHKI